MAALWLIEMFNKADKIDVEEGLQAYARYHDVMLSMAIEYRMQVDKVIAAFVSLSPNSDYIGNLRSTVSVLEGLRQGVPKDHITVSTYRHCRDRAIEYVLGTRSFLKETKGLKVINFYHNVLNPYDNRWVTVDGHISAIWQNKQLTMKEALITKKQYIEIAANIKNLAFQRYMFPNQFQAILWFTRKRLLNIKFDPQLDILRDPTDTWRTVVDLSDIKPYQFRAPIDVNLRDKISTPHLRNGPSLH